MRFWKRRSGVESRSTLRGMAYTLVAIGAALWGAFRHARLRELTERAAA